MLISILITLSSLASYASAICNQGGVEESETAVYSAALDEIFPGEKFRDKPIKLLVIEDITSVDEYGGKNIFKEDLKQFIPEIPQDTLESFLNQNKQFYTFTDLGDLSMEYQLRRPSEMDGWRDFYERYPNSPGLISLSRVGFNREKNGALVYITHTWGDSGGNAYLMLLKREKGKWKVQHREIISIRLP
jgi:hypothetical protein